MPRPSALAPRGPAVWRARLEAQRNWAHIPRRAVVDRDAFPRVDGYTRVWLSCGHVREVEWRGQAQLPCNKWPKNRTEDLEC